MKILLFCVLILFTLTSSTWAGGMMILNTGAARSVVSTGTNYLLYYGTTDKILYYGTSDAIIKY